MCREKIRKGITHSIDFLLEENEVEIKLFGNPVTDFEFNDLSRSQIKAIRELLIKKIDNCVV